jgi:hypothetical protein
MKVYVSKDGQQYGPYTIEQLREYVQQGNFTTGDHACFDGQNWVTIAQVPGFAAGGDLVTTPQYPQAVQQQPASADASTSLPKKKATHHRTRMDKEPNRFVSVVKWILFVACGLWLLLFVCFHVFVWLWNATF